MLKASNADQQSFVNFSYLFISLTFQLTKYFHLQVTPGSPAAKAGLRSRDILLAINGELLMDLSRVEAEAIIRTSKAGKLDLVLKL